MCPSIFPTYQRFSHIARMQVYNETVRDAFGTTDERIAGFIFLGTPARPLEERPRPDYADVVREWTN